MFKKLSRILNNIKMEFSVEAFFGRWNCCRYYSYMFWSSDVFKNYLWKEFDDFSSWNYTIVLRNLSKLTKSFNFLQIKIPYKAPCKTINIIYSTATNTILEIGFYIPSKHGMTYKTIKSYKSTEHKTCKMISDGIKFQQIAQLVYDV